MNSKVSHTLGLIVFKFLMQVFGHPWWRHQMETFSELLSFCAGNSANSPQKGPWRGALMFSLICAWTNCWVNNQDACDLKPPNSLWVTVVQSPFTWYQGPITQKGYELIIESLKNSSCCNMKNNYHITSQFCTCHDSSVVMVCAKLWYDLINILHVKATCILDLNYELNLCKMDSRHTPALIELSVGPWE